LKKQWCVGAITAEYLARMEDVLHLYSLAYDEKRPVVCFDELPVQLLGEVVEPLPMQAGKPKRFDYEYERGGVASLLVAFEPLTGKRLVETSKQRTKADYCRFQQRVASTWSDAEKIVLVQDNLNTHNASSFYENLPPAEAFTLAQHFEMHYTPKKGSWLNMAELELSALSRVCLSRRIPSVEELDREVQAIVKERNESKIKVRWQFSISQAREKLSRHYEKVKSRTSITEH
jgi:transposase